ncbi:TRAP transporter small permease [Bengtsoniella intestinalis]|uniref:TRAP transporter small permease n=1 Tax=Bengtsoniella intestinalis TaxID=3073143 RepID=UPI00391F2FEC
MKRILTWLQNLENFILVLTFSVMVITCFIQVINRNIFKIPFTGFEEISRYCMVYMVLLGTELGLRDGTQISVSAFVDHLPKVLHDIFAIITRIIVIGFAAIMCKSGMTMVITQLNVGQMTPGLGIPMSVPYFSLVLSFGIITIVQMVTLVNQFRNFGKPKAEMTEKEENT